MVFLLQYECVLMLNYRILAEVLSELLFNIITQPSKT
jgi:hypothetical protein